MQAIKKEYATSESVQELNVEFEGDALTLDNVSVDGTTTSGGWHVATKWDPARVRFGGLVVFIVQYLYSVATVECVHR